MYALEKIYSIIRNKLIYEILQFRYEKCCMRMQLKLCSYYSCRSLIIIIRMEDEYDIRDQFIIRWAAPFIKLCRYVGTNVQICYLPKLQRSKSVSFARFLIS